MGPPAVNVCPVVVEVAFRLRVNVVAPVMDSTFVSAGIPDPAMGMPMASPSVAATVTSGVSTVVLPPFRVTTLLTNCVGVAFRLGCCLMKT